MKKNDKFIQFEFVVVVQFDDFKRGDTITDETVIKNLEETSRSHYVHKIITTKEG